MARNVEIKARARDWDAMRAAAAALADGPETVLVQRDAFFACPEGRLKLRELEGGAPAELIFYRRPDASGPKVSDYAIARTADGPALRAVLAAALGERRVVAKTRRLYLAGQTRIHLDEVEGLGRFLELEVVLRPEQDAAEGERIARGLMERLGVRPEDLVEGAYADLLAR